MKKPGDETLRAIVGNGFGFCVNKLEKVFERFHRIAGQGIPGSGLGLAIVKRVAQHCGLAIQLMNRPGGGLSAAVRWAPAVAACHE